MRSFQSELQYLSELYHALRLDLTNLIGNPKSDNATSVVAATLHNRELLGRIEQMNTRVAQLAHEWDILSDRLDPTIRKEIVALAERARNEGAQLLFLCTSLLGELEGRRGNLKMQLAEVCKGSRFLQSVKPLKNNYPKFVDSLG